MPLLSVSVPSCTLAVGDDFIASLSNHENISASVLMLLLLIMVKTSNKNDWQLHWPYYNVIFRILILLIISMDLYAS